MNDLGFAIVGCGGIADRYLGLLGEGYIPAARLVTACDINKGRAEKAERVGATHYTDMHEMMRCHHADVDVVCVLTGSGHHAQHVIELAPYGKHVVVEKPMALLIDDADEMISACDAAGVKLFVVKQNQFNLPVQQLRYALEEGRFGKLVLGTVRVRWRRTQEYYDKDPWRGTWALDGGVFANQASHHVDLLEWMLGAPERVYATTRAALVNIKLADTGVATVQFRNRAIGLIEATTAARPYDLEGSLSILGENGAVEIGGFSANQLKTWQFADAQPSDSEVFEKYGKNPDGPYGYPHRKYLEHVVECVTKGSPSLVDGLEGRKSLELITAIYESAETGQEVALSFRPNRSRLGRRSESDRS